MFIPLRGHLSLIPWRSACVHSEAFGWLILMNKTQETFSENYFSWPNQRLKHSIRSGGGVLATGSTGRLWVGPPGLNALEVPCSLNLFTVVFEWLNDEFMYDVYLIPLWLFIYSQKNMEHMASCTQCVLGHGLLWRLAVSVTEPAGVWEEHKLVPLVFCLFNNVELLLSLYIKSIANAKYCILFAYSHTEYK